MEIKFNTIRLNTEKLNAAARAAGMTAEEFVSTIRSISMGHEVCAHFLRTDGSQSVFLLK